LIVPSDDRVAAYYADQGSDHSVSCFTIVTYGDADSFPDAYVAPVVFELAATPSAFLEDARYCNQVTL
jgi:hypothetical protein